MQINGSFNSKSCACYGTMKHTYGNCESELSTFQLHVTHSNLHDNGYNHDHKDYNSIGVKTSEIVTSKTACLMVRCRAVLNNITFLLSFTDVLTRPRHEMSYLFSQQCLQFLCWQAVLLHYHNHSQL